MAWFVEDGALSEDEQTNRATSNHLLSSSLQEQWITRDRDSSFRQRGERGFSDGNLTSVAFNRQQGIYYDDTRDLLCVAGNHGKKQRMTSPWDICMDKRDNEGLFIAMAGSHTSTSSACDLPNWRRDLKDGKTWRISGTGQERSLNNRVKIESADWAQPSAFVAVSVAFVVALVAIHGNFLADIEK
ncbi:hypothetical protein PROFUN_13338 [Planoprotostelium fungivorum]|uniref:Uncharacterized protein n=1 Tax=Planoprotostelium fungivorum TaxID=1890364 RepID=A0A2P6N4K8_9EUKA|nr:hypothetical protein PROFUN_13338 [Planoprotostelium fungivorum]